VITVIFSLDYEIHGNGEGDPLELMVAPTDRLISQLNKFGAKLSIFAEAAEIAKFKTYKDDTGLDRFHYDKIVQQLHSAYGAGHEVELHIHPSYDHAESRQRGWMQDWSEYDLAALSAQRTRDMIAGSKHFLEQLMAAAHPGYRASVFRACNLSVMPSGNIADALIACGMRADSSVFKYGQSHGLVNFDYTDAESETLPWPADQKNFCHRDATSPLTEFPIYAEHRWITAFLSLNRLFRLYQSYRHQLAAPAHKTNGDRLSGQSIAAKLKQLLLQKHAWKADFNQASARQLIAALERAHGKYGNHETPVPFVLIGHPKLFNSHNQRQLEHLLHFIQRHPDKYRFGGYGDFLKNG
jgi:hypothetical protein